MQSLPHDFSNFKAQDSRTMAVSTTGELYLDAACPVAILTGRAGEVRVEIDADKDDLASIQISQQGDTVIVKHAFPATASSRYINMNGGSIVVSNISAANVSIINGRLYVDNRAVADSNAATESRKLPRIIMHVPDGFNLKAFMEAASILHSAANLDRVKLALTGQSRVNVTANDLHIDASGRSQIDAKVTGGKLQLDLSGQGNVDAEGSFAKVWAELSGMGNIRTKGIVSGDYTASASGMGSISHDGAINGRISKDVSGMARIRLG